VRAHDFTGGIAQSGLVWTVPLPDEAVTITRRGRRLDVAVNDLPVIDSTGSPLADVPATVSFAMTWRATGGMQQAGKGGTVAPVDPFAYLGRLARASARGTFSGTSGTFTFRSSAKPQKTIFGVLGTEQAGALLPGVASCGTCAAVAGPPTTW
jgi:hypothetical protein